MTKATKHRGVDPTLQQIDEQLYVSVQHIDILTAIAPTNYLDQKKQFFESNFSKAPQFTYNQNNIALFEKKRQLFNLPIEQLNNKALYTLYSEVIQSYVDKLDQFQHIGSPEFLYDSLRYYGEPANSELKNAHYLLHVTSDLEKTETDTVSIEEIQHFFENFAQANHYPLKLEIVDSMIANALVSGDVVKINRKAKINRQQLKALAHHELGVHLATSLNAKAQPLKILALGSPVNTTSQEGLAMLCEYLAGFMSLDRLRMLALRVVSVDSMIKEKDFRRTFSMLVEEFKLSEEKAFAMCSRVYRGGGFTKDYLYLKGFKQIITAYNSKTNINNLLCGKISMEQLPLINKLVDQGVFIAPNFISPAIRRPMETDPVLKFVVDSLK
ncbi:flavohemoglobin expression-modulating QEGLA motif protein [Thalassotalea marina]|uniref:Flavohemoglobin expression-modulating QEGLA motif protein n=1 Tax=Thalassotalea marina TaxID=1673741 RepID=A0A919EL57_9GAMM|nr:flavohemoglobin expression-modulating QEGLA motif protein [Thalassotalea marina]GHF91520.1 hypothetical protein GCM10017161_19220 [Thalassotalea marina]